MYELRFDHTVPFNTSAGSCGAALVVDGKGKVANDLLGAIAATDQALTDLGISWLNATIQEARTGSAPKTTSITAIDMLR